MSSSRSNESDFFSIQSSISQSSCSAISLGINRKDIRRLDKVYDSLSRNLLEKRCRKVELLEKIKQKIWKREEIKQSISFRRKVQEENILRKKLQLQRNLLNQLKEHNAVKQHLELLEAENDRKNKENNLDGKFFLGKKLFLLIQQNNQIKSSIQKIISLINLSQQKEIEQQSKALERERASLVSKYKAQKQDLLASINLNEASGHDLIAYSVILSQQDKFKLEQLSSSEKMLQISTMELIKQKAKEQQEKRSFYEKILTLKEGINMLREKRKQKQNQFANSNNDQY